MSYIQNPHSDDPFGERELAAYTADRAAKVRPGAPPLKALERMTASRDTLIERLQETIASQAGSIASQARLIAEMSQDAIRGRKAASAMDLLGVKLGINPVPRDPEEFTAAIMSVLDKLREELSSKQEV